MFKFVVVFAVVLPGLACAAQKAPECLVETVNTHQVMVTGEYGGKPFAFTITNETPARTAQNTPPAKPSDQACPLTS